MKAHRITARMAAVLLLGVVAAPIVTTANTAQAVGPVARAECTATVGDSVSVQAEPVTVQASLSEAIGDSLSASLQSESKTNVVSVGPAGPDTPNTLALKLNTAEAVPGEWSLSIKGTGGECTGKIKIIGSGH